MTPRFPRLRSMTQRAAADSTLSQLARSPRLALLSVATLASISLACSSEDSVRHSTQAQTLASASPPAGLLPGEVPQFVSVSFDDNFSSEGVNWATSFFQNLSNPTGAANPLTFDGTAARTSFFYNSTYMDYNTGAWGAAVSAGHETADHTIGHGSGFNYSQSQWASEVNGCRSALSNGLGVPLASIEGFRSPFLAYNDALFSTLSAASPGFVYDSSIENCWGASEDGTNCSWPYTLDNGSPDADSALAKFGSAKVAAVNAHPGLWELPVSTLIVPPDSLAGEYGFSSGLRARVQAALGANTAPSFYEQSTGKVGGLDITLIVDGQMTKAEALATLKYSLDLRLAGNRAPLIFVAHTHVYASGYGAATNIQSTAERRALIEEFIAYALSKPQVRVRPMSDIVDWMQNPSALGQCTPQCSGKECGSDGCGGTCGSCEGSSSCSSTGVCEAACVPSCSGLECGDDGCGGSCGSCANGAACTAGACVSGACTAQEWSSAVAYSGGSVVAYNNQEYRARWYSSGERPDLHSGADGSGKVWTLGVACATSSCTPACSGLECGDDGCGGSCGSCGAGESCDAGLCQNSGGGGCSGQSVWQNGVAYSAGDIVVSAGAAYQCKPWPYSGWCGAGSSYEPGVGYAWQDAWNLLASCN